MESGRDDNLYEEIGSDELPLEHCLNCGEELDLCDCPKQECENPQCPCHQGDEDD